ncbi:alcohol dehydrogenase [Capronia coronata CBS 617.96]|uniref:Alcohol dehydrogenase n=1 Tax=Capronia coronata CBS 617.96 TaxID=1182541 RepID=W9YL53_9EURO|nr:alcohol dehydrogenase [Capronia coronata CBS 617.96]EXJ90380.1 alcohol dehydrogenase [Capronia coronata CBS 617.96]
MAPQIAWLGLGNMGRGMCKNLVEKGNLTHPLIIYNRTTARAQELSSKIGHSTVSPSIAEAARKADIIFYCLGDDAAVLSTLDEILRDDNNNLAGKILVDCSTVHPDTTAQETQLVEARGGTFVACPVFGAPAMAESGQLICVLAGASEAVDKVKPYCKGVMGRANLEFSGQEPSRATLLKLIGNTFVLSMVEALAEGHVVAEKSGLGVDTLHQFIELMFPGPYTAYSNRLRTGDYYNRAEPLFAVDLARKDARHAMALAEKTGCRMKNVELADSYLKVVKETQGQKGDIAGIYGAKRLESGLPFENAS